MQTRIHQCCEWKQMFQNYLNFLKNVITGDETCVRHFDSLTKSAMKYGNTLTLSFQKESNKPNLMIIFFDRKGITYHRFILPKATMSGKH